MNIKAQNGKICRNIAFDEVYIKPFYYNEDTVENWAVCSNLYNIEVVLGYYNSNDAAKHMVHIIKLYEDTPFRLDMLSDVEVCEDMYAAAAYRLEKSKREVKPDEKK